MQDLLDKLEELKKALLSTKADAKSSLVPAVKTPTLKPISMSSKAAAPKPVKMPGVSPSSNKDPAKVAQQLKNPKPMKPKIEVMKTDKNGQWSLEEVEKAVHEPHIPEQTHEGDASSVKPKKYQGGDPRHANDVMGSNHYRGSGPQTKSGQLRPQVSANPSPKLAGVTSGQSIKKDGENNAV